jgi:hypothetical protein
MQTFMWHLRAVNSVTNDEFRMMNANLYVASKSCLFSREVEINDEL